MAAATSASPKISPEAIHPDSCTLLSLGISGERIFVGNIESPRVSVVVVNWDARSLLRKCLVSLTAQRVSRPEIIVVDNGSSDGSAGVVLTDFPDVHLIRLQSNLGFARAANIGIRAAKGEYVVLLNNDTEPEPGWLAELVRALDGNPDIGFCASKMVLYDNPSLADACGDFQTREGIPGALYRRRVLEETGGFDDDFFIVHEDSDLSFRARLLGYRCLYVPTAVVRHHVSATLGKESNTAVYYAQRNMEFVFFKNMPTGLLLKYLPLHLLAKVLLFVRYILHRQARVFLRAELDAIRMMPKMLKKRRQIQRSRRISAAEIDALLDRDWLRMRLWQALRRCPHPGTGS